MAEEKHADQLMTCVKMKEDNKVATQEFDIIISKTFKFHSIR